ncbi:MAG: response regulator transcription factor [Treponema sp.]|nr:response regulator transcription factor [Treponema sp.]
MTEKPRIVIVEDHPVMREGLASYFTGTGRWQVMGTASTLAEAKELLSGVHADIALLDIQLEDGWGLDVISWLAEQEQNAPIMAVYSSFDDYAHVSAALGMGVRAYICKRRGERELENALQNALCGAVYIDEAAQVKLNNETDLARLLTKRETEILSLVKNGLSNKQIAARLGISHRTVENILRCVYDKTGIKTRLELQKM